MEVFYHVSNDELAEGTILNPMYGQKIHDPFNFFRVNDHNYSQYIKEMIFEEVRKTDFPSCPSRLNSIYLTTSYDSASQYQTKHQSKYIYEVEIEHPNLAKTFDMTWMDLSNLQYYGTVKDMAKNYYSGKSIDGPFHWGIYEGVKGNPEKPVPFLETLYDGKATIKKCLQVKEPMV